MPKKLKTKNKEMKFNKKAIQDLGHLKVLSWDGIARSNKGIFISRRKYTLDLLNAGNPQWNGKKKDS